MGFFDKAKHFLGGHGVKVHHSIIERQDPNAVTLPVGDGVVKGRFVVTADSASTVLSMKAEFCVDVKHPDGREEVVVLGEDVFPAPHVSRMDDMLQYPYDLAPGQSIEDFFIIDLKRNIPETLAQYNLSQQAHFFVRTTVDVKGSPFDPETRSDVRILY